MVMVRVLAAALLLIACHARNPGFCPDGEDPTGECIAIDAAIACYGVAPFVVCVPPPKTPRTLGRVDTTAGCDEIVTVGRELCVVTGTDVNIVQRTRLSGLRPLVILASNALTVTSNGIVDAAGAITTGGPGADLACDASATAGGAYASGGGGGAGGSLGSRGGSGGKGNGDNGAAGTAAPPVVGLSVLQGGCSGTDGGDGGGSGTRGGRGFGGGGIYLVAGQTLTIHGIVTASGTGGRGGRTAKAGGGGGGSGGMIVLYAPTVEVTASAQIFANGGGGGAGAPGSTAGGDGTTSSAPLSPGKGGIGQGDGGDGAFVTTTAETGMSSTDGGGGGGGGVGVIYVLGGDFGAASLSPPPT
jgi:hypothetical protein